MNKRIGQQILIGLGALFAVSPLMAHPLGGEVGSITSGLLHPLLGVDHMIAMLAVSIWAVQRGSRFIWQLPLLFSLVLLGGAVLASTGIYLPLMESFIALSILIMGLAISLRQTVNALVGMLMIAGFGLYHGFAHGIALPAGGLGLEYLAGLWLSTAMIHIIGIISAMFLQRTSLLHWSGAPLIGLGGLLLLGA